MRDPDHIQLAHQAELLVAAGYLIRDGNPHGATQSFHMTWKAWAALMADAEQPIVKPCKVTREQIERELATQRAGIIECLKF